MLETPRISGSTYSASTTNMANYLAMQENAMQQQVVGSFPKRIARSTEPRNDPIIEEKVMTLRMVQVLIADPNENIPLAQRLIFNGDPKLTDSTDQELFFEIDIKTLLDKHNEVRVKIVDKKVKERTEYLEPIKIRELKMVVVSIATF